MKLHLTKDQAAILGMVLNQVMVQTDEAIDTIQSETGTSTNEWHAHQLWLQAIQELHQVYIDAEEEESDKPIVMAHYRDEEGIMDHSYSTLELADMDLNIIQCALQFAMNHGAGTTEEWKQLFDGLEPIRKSHGDRLLDKLSIFPDQFTYEELQVMEDAIDYANTSPYSEAVRQALAKIETQKNYLRHTRHV